MSNQYGVNIATIALIYSYLANDNYSLDMEIINKFLLNVKEKMIKKHERYDIDLTIKNADIYLNSFFITGGMRNNKMLMLNISNDLKDIYSYYSNYIPKELLTETLNEEALQIIGVNKSKLKTCIESTIHVKTEEIYEKNKELAERLAITKNSHLGTEKVKIINSFSQIKDNRIIHFIKVSYTRTRECLDENMFKENIKTRKKTYTRYYGF